MRKGADKLRARCVICQLTRKMNLLLHVCCAPCAVYPAEQLSKDGIKFTGVFFNPNIHPLDEFERRKNTVGELASEVIYYDEFDQTSWEHF